MANDEFFLNSSKIYYDFDVVRSIYFSWISTIKVLLKNNKEEVFKVFGIKEYYSIFENLTGILFDDNNHLNYVLKIINYMNSLLDLMT